MNNKNLLSFFLSLMLTFQKLSWMILTLQTFAYFSIRVTGFFVVKRHSINTWHFQHFFTLPPPQKKTTLKSEF